ncbi:Mss4-like protein [Thelonectria olida]|uniref:Mss4-like protein n=1 Tax=Thelonectria olida TaxID=1576542 RepID=A0A9P8WIM0_9HYPO|nr:Mss4-like protein [Thelonectria olida]
MSPTAAANTESSFPVAGIAQDGWSTEDEATATCYCGTVQLALPTSKPGFVTSVVCHCSDCRKITASMFSSLIVILDTHLRHIRGEENLKQYSQSQTIERKGNAMTNFFCSTCGSLMYRRAAGYPGASLLRLGTVDDFKLAETKLRPECEQYLKYRVGWLQDIEKVHHVEGQLSL